MSARDRVGRGGPATVVIIPAFNEQAALPGVVAELRAHASGMAIIVVDDGSTDATAARAREAGADIVLSLPYNCGVGAALRVGLLAARRLGANAVQCDADGQHPPVAIAELVAGLTEADIVVGARFAGVGDYRVRGPRAWAMRVLSAIMSRVHHTRLTDVTSGFRAFGPRAVDVLSRRMPAQYLGDTVEALMIAGEEKLVVRQCPVAMRGRQGGQASHHPGAAAVYLLRSMTIVALAGVRRLGSRGRRTGRAGVKADGTEGEV
ncbi:MAG: glycosyltransferase family 2 protein [Bifidobacteriaceae bacterium]|nr:glycosyltransferase family 2 protein [Bifidobacteriaceae bacterium]